jgi:hypothetical protein
MKIKRGREVLFGIVVAVICLGFVLAVGISADVVPKSIKEDLSYKFNFSIQNLNSSANITQVNITAPASFSIDSGTISSSANGEMTSSQSKISWKNSTNQLVLSSSTAYFWFNATASTPGHYNFTIEAVDESGNLNTSYVAVVVNDTTPPLVTFASPQTGAFYNTRQVLISITNSSDAQAVWWYNGSTNLSYSPQIYQNFSEGSNTIITYANDSNGNVNSTSVSFTIDTIAPVISYSSDSEQNGSVINRNNTIIGASVSDANFANFTVFLYNSGRTLINSNTTTSSSASFSYANLANGAYYFNITAYDRAGNINYTQTRSVTVNFSSSDNPQNNLVNNPQNQSFWINTYSYADKDFSLYSSLNKELGVKERLGLKINGSEHYVGVANFTNTSATINVSSTSQQAVLVIGEAKKFDVESDDYYDLKITLLEIKNNKANLTIDYLHEKINVTTYSAQVNNLGNNVLTNISNNSSQNNSSGNAGKAINFKKMAFLIAAILAVLVVIVGLVYIIFRTKKDFLVKNTGNMKTK